MDSEKGFFKADDSGEVLEAVRQRIIEIIHGPGSCGEYRTVWHTFKMEGLNVPCIIVQDILKEVDPEGCQLSKAHRLKRRTYHCLGPNYTWHIDGYDKLKPFGFPIHGAIDGFSRKILWLEVTRSNNSPHNNATYFLSTVNELKGCPRQLITDLGTENGLRHQCSVIFMMMQMPTVMSHHLETKELKGGGRFFHGTSQHGGAIFSKIWNLRVSWTLLLN